MSRIDSSAENYRIEFHGEVFQSLHSNRAAYIVINGEKYDVLPKTLIKYKSCSNAKEYVEAIEYFAYEVFILKTIPNDEFFRILK